MEDLGLETERLIAAKEILYFEGIRRNIDSGKWEELLESRTGIDFCHLFAWWEGRDETDVLIGRMWASKDGKGRAQYPMILCAHCRGLPLEWVLEQVPARLEELELKCLEAQTAAEVKAAIDEARDALRRAAQETQGQGAKERPSDLPQLLQHPDLGEGHEKLHRVLYLIEEEMADYGPGRKRQGHFDVESLAAPQLRVPQCADSPAESALRWKDFMHTQLDPAASLLVVAPLTGKWAQKDAVEESLGRALIIPAEETWAEIIVGRPTLSQLYSIRASLEAIPRTTDIPYKLDDEFTPRAEEVLASLGREEGPQTIIQPSPEDLTDATLASITRVLTREKSISERIRALPRNLLLIPVVIIAILILVLGIRSLASRSRPATTTTTTVPSLDEAHFDAEAWRDLCDAYYEWFGRLASELRDADRHERWSQDPYLKDKVLSVIDREQAGELDLDPRKIARSGPGKAISYLRSNPPVRAKTSGSVEETKAALEAIQGIRRAFGSTDWELRKAVASVREEAENLGWPKVAEEIGPSVEKLAAVTGLVKGTDELLGARPALERTLSLLSELRAFGKAGKDSGAEPLLKEAQSIDESLRGLHRTSLEELPARLESLKESLLKAGEQWLASYARQAETLESPALSQEWQEWRKRLAEQLSKSLANKELERFARRRTSASRAKRFFAALDDKEQLPAGLPEAVDQLPQKPWVEALRQAAARKREETLAGAARLVPRDQADYSFSVAEFAETQEWRDLCKDYSDWRSEGPRVLKTLATIQDALDVGRVADEKPPNSAKTIRELYEECLASPVLKAEEVRKAVKPVLDRVERLQTIRGSNDRKGLASAALAAEPEPTLEVLRLTWLRLRELKGPAGPEGKEGREQQARLAKRLEAAYANVADPAWRAALHTELRQAQIRDLCERLAGVDGGPKDKVLAQFAAFSDQEITRAKTLESQAQIQCVDDLRDLAGKVLEAQGDCRQQKVHEELFRKESQVHREFAGKLTSQILKSWLEEIRHYYRLAGDPRGEHETWTGALEARRKEIDALVKLNEQAQALSRDEVSQLETTHRKAKTTVQKMLALPAIRKHEDAIAELVKQAQSEMGDLADAIGKAFGKLETPADWKKRVSSRDEVSSSPALNTEWRRRRDQILGRVSSDTWKERPGSYIEARAATERLAKLLATLDDKSQLPDKLQDEADQALLGDWRGALANAIHEERERTLTQAIGHVFQEDAPEIPVEQVKQQDWWKALCKEYGQRTSDARQILSTLYAVQGALDSAYTLEEKPGTASAAMGELYSDCQGKPVFKEIATKSIVKPVLARLNALAEVSASEDRKTLAATALKASAESPEKAWAAWRRLGKLGQVPWPQNLDDLSQEVAIHKKLQALIESCIKDADRKKRLHGELAQGSVQRWQAAFGRLAPGDSERAVGLLTDLGLDLSRIDPLGQEFGGGPSQLTEHARYNLLLHQTFAGRSVPDREVVSVRDRFIAAVKSKMPNTAKRPEVQDFLLKLATVETSEDNVGDLSKAGPAGSVLGRWQCKPLEDGKAAEFSWELEGQRRTLLFRRVDPRDAGMRPFYLATTEVPIGLLLEVINAAGKWQEFKGVLYQHESYMGPLSWKINESQTGLEVRKEWVEQTVKLPTPSAAEKEKPSLRSPVQGLSAPAAIYFCRLMKCRPPSPAEWKEALAAIGGEAKGVTWNLRDKAWQEELRRIFWAWRSESKLASYQVRWPDAGIFWPADVARASRKASESALPSAKSDDGTVWFAPVDSGAEQRFHHLVGNVAEFVHDQPDAIEGLSDSSAKGVAGFVSRTLDHLYVIGGSALSPPEVVTDKPYQADLITCQQGRSDVGFRLAFSAPRRTLSQQLAVLTKDLPYLSPK